jgi:hypothetical protein
MTITPVSVAISAGLAKIEASTPNDVKKFLDSAVIRVAKKQSSFTTDDVHFEIDSLAASGKRITKINPSAIGPAMMRAARAGFIQKINQFIPSTRPSRHGNSLPVWMSNLYKVA